MIDAIIVPKRQKFYPRHERSRPYLTPAEVDKLLKASKDKSLSRHRRTEMNVSNLPIIAVLLVAWIDVCFSGLLTKTQKKLSNEFYVRAIRIRFIPRSE